jgi:tetratricopeptide (TPR) repeat protein
MSKKSYTTTPWTRLRAVIHFWSARTHRHYGIVFSDRNEFEDAVEEYGRAIAFNPAMRKAYLERGILYWRELNEPKRAIADLTAALQLKPGWPEALFCRGLAYEAAGDFPAAIQDLAGYVSSDDHAWRSAAERQLVILRSLTGEALPAGESA